MPDTASPSPAAFPTRLLIAGAGRMGGALLQGWLARGLDPARVAIIEPHPSAALHDLVRTHDLALNPRGPTEPAEALVLGIKPQMLGDVARQLAPHIGPDTLLVSILAGKTVADLARALPGPRAIVRAMPNLPAAIGRGATGAYATPDTSPAQREAAHALLSATGLVAWVEREELIDAVTALSGSGPAYLFYLVESLAAAGVA
ncbi:MAG: pyrroline-5-carboxylate reductase, partial [Methylobacteriaceae bacterium]|nr:pyrroline-5-carboxylate reductase [Methylobacteriaceae bacterium]